MMTVASEVAAEALLAAADQLRLAAGHQVVDGTDAEDLLRSIVGQLIESAAQVVGTGPGGGATADVMRRRIEILTQ